MADKNFEMQAASVSNTRHTSNSDEWRTPAEIIEAAREALGGAIDLDPASSGTANKSVGATRFYDRRENGFVRQWSPEKGCFSQTVFLNPPGGKIDGDGQRVLKDCQLTGACGLPKGHSHKGPTGSASKAWWFKLVHEYLERRVHSAVFLGFSIEILQTTQIERPAKAFLPLDCMLCFPARRLAFLDGRGQPVKGNTHASIIVGLAPQEERGSVMFLERFRDAFSPIGQVIWP